MNNLFKDAYFGKMYMTRDGRKAIYFFQNGTSKWHDLIVEGERISLPYQDSGLAVGKHLKNPEWPEDIVSEWEESINEEDLDKLANNYRCESFTTPVTDGENIDTYIESMNVSEYINLCEISFKDGFKAGYLKAKKGE